MATITLDPENAAPSIARRVNQIIELEKQIKEIVTRYDGLNALDAKLTELGVKTFVDALIAEGT